MPNYILYRIGEFLALHLPAKSGYSLAKAVSSIHYLVSKQDRISVSSNLKAIFPGINKQLLKKYTRGVFITFGIYLINFLKCKKIDLEYIKKNVVIEGLEYVNQALDLKKGVIILSAHIGNWEFGGIALSLMGYPMNAITLTHKSKAVNDFFNRHRVSKGFKVIPLGRAVRGCLEAFSRNEIVCILGDRDFTQGGITVNFFGRPTIIPKGPATFFLKNNIPVVMGFTIQEKEGKCRLFFSPPIKFEPAGDYEKDLRGFTELYLKQIEDCIRDFPEQWAMFRQFWI